MSFVSCSDGGSWQTQSGMVWNTLYNISWEGSENLADSIMPALTPVDNSLSIFNRNSLVSKVNDSIATPVDKHFINVYLMSREINEASDGMFDPTLSPAITAWGFGPGHNITVDTVRCDSLQQFVGLHLTSLKGRLLCKRDIRTQFNFSALAKGYGCDLLAEMFRRNGIDNFLIEIGGEIVCSGCNRKGEKWRISIDRPNQDATPGQSSAEIIAVTNCGIATSGNYRNYHTEAAGNTTFGHTISPKTCRPLKTDILSATVIATNCMEADALATACMAVGAENAKALCKKRNTLLMLVLSDSSIYKSPGFPTVGNP